MNRDVLLSLLALDSYNRGYGRNLYASGNPEENDESGRWIGGAKVLTDSRLEVGSEGEAADFYAIAYQLGSETIISYRGTNFGSTVPPGGTVFDSPIAVSL